MRRFIAATAALMLLACGSQQGDENQTLGQEAGNAGAGGEEKAGEQAPMAASGATAANFMPGEWEMTRDPIAIQTQGATDGRSMPLPPRTTVTACLTQDQAARPEVGFLIASSEDGGCSSNDLSFDNARIRGTAQCSLDGATAEMTLDGEYTATTFEMRHQVSTEQDGMSIQLTSRVNGRHMGDCTPG